MIPNYIRPQLLIRQLLEVLPQVTEPSMNTFVFGPQYKLNRYSVADERKEMKGADYAEGAASTIPYENSEDGSQVDKSSVKLYIEDAELAVARFEYNSSTNRAYYNDRIQPNEFVIKNQSTSEEANLSDLGSSLTAELDGRPVGPGDLAVVYAADGDFIAKRQIMSVRRSQEAASLEIPACGDTNCVDTTAITTLESQNVSVGTIAVTSADAGASAEKFAAAGSSYGQELAEKFTILITEKADSTTAGACKVRTPSNNFEDDDVAVTWNTNKFDIVIAGSDLTLSTTGAAELRVGDSFVVVVKNNFDAMVCAQSAAGKEVKVSGTYQHSSDSNIVLTCIKGGLLSDATWLLSDTEGLEDTLEASASSLASGVAFGMSGVTVTLDRSGGLHRLGDISTIGCVAAGETGAYGVLSLSAPVGDPTLLSGSLDSHPYTIEIRKVYAGEVSDRGLGAPIEQWAATNNGVEIKAPEAGQSALNLPIADFVQDSAEPVKLVPVKSDDAGGSKLFVSYNELVPASAGEGIKRVTKTSELAEFGDKDQANPLGLGASLAISGSQGKPIYVGRVPSDDVAGFTSVLTKAENIEALYAHAPLTDDYEIQLLCKDHVNLMSQETHKKWRRAYIGTDNPGDYKAVGSKADGSSHTATVTSDGKGNVVVSDIDGTFVSSKLLEGDLLRINFTKANAWGDDTYDKSEEGGYVIDSVVDEETLLLKSGPSGQGIQTPLRYEVWKKDNANNIADYIAARSSSFGSRRVNNVFVDGGQWINARDELTTLHPMFVAAEIAGLRSAVPPQQGLTNTEVASISAAPAMYIKYNESSLNKVAANGSFVVTQEYQDGPRFIRHQLTTKTDSGNLYYEDSVGVNVDEISLQVKHALRPFIGKRNVNPGTITEIFSKMYSILEGKMTVPTALQVIGPALIGFSDLAVRINDTFKDRIDVTATLNVPLPLNVIDVTLNAVASFNSGELSLESLGISAVTTTVDSPFEPVTIDAEGNAITV